VVLPLGITVSMFANIDAAFSGEWKVSLL